MASLIEDVDPSTWAPHALHHPGRIWRETNCYVDLWIEILGALGHEPVAVMPFTVTQDFEGDHFTFFKMPPGDIETLYGLTVQELAIFDSLEAHLATQLLRRRLVLVEVDGFHLPDTRGTSYHEEHVKTTIGVARMDLAARRLGYFHGLGYHVLEGPDFDGVLRRMPEQKSRTDALFPYVEFVKAEAPALRADALLGASRELLRGHLRRRPPANPVSAYRRALPAHLDALACRPMAYFHLYTFNTLRQLGANFELLGSYAGWLGDHGESGLDPIAAACAQLAGDAKALQFQLARAVARQRRFEDRDQILGRMERAYDAVLGGLATRYG